MRATSFVCGLLSACAFVNAAPEPVLELELEERDGVQYNVFRDDILGTEMRFVMNSGVCETTPGVQSMSG